MAKGLETCCSELANKMTEADKNMKLFMQKAAELEGDRNQFLKQSEEIQLFLSRFQLTDDEVGALYRASLDERAGAQTFFRALKRLESACQDCRVMVEQHCYSAGFELMDALGQHQEQAYRRLFEWVKARCEAMADSSTVEDIDTTTQSAVRHLRSLPVYLSQCQDLVVASRRSQLVQRFVVALTQGGSAGQISRAIDLHAHDAARYVGDMLAWMHQAAASEQELLEAIFGADSEGGSEREEHARGLTNNELLARCLQGLGRPLRVRIQQTLESKVGLETLYTLTDLLAFYEKTFSRVVPLENAVHSAVKGCLAECKRLFLNALGRQAEALVASPPPYPLDLSAAHATRECARQLQEVLRVCACALSPLPRDAADACHVDAVLSEVITPLLQACRLSGRALQNSDMAIFMLNNVGVLRVELKESAKRHGSAEATANWLALLDEEQNTWVGVLVAEEAQRTLRRSDFDKLLELVELLPEGVVASQQAGLTQDRVGTVLRAFYASLFSTAAAQLERLKDPEVREFTRRAAAEAVADAHAKVHVVVSRDAHGYDKAVLLHTVEEIRVLLSCNK